MSVNSFELVKSPLPTPKQYEKDAEKISKTANKIGLAAIAFGVAGIAMLAMGAAGGMPHVFHLASAASGGMFIGGGLFSLFALVMGLVCHADKEEARSMRCVADARKSVQAQREEEGRQFVPATDLKFVTRTDAYRP